MLGEHKMNEKDLCLGFEVCLRSVTVGKEAEISNKEE